MSASPAGPALVSVIVPALDEEQELPGVLDHLARLEGRWEVLVADGGSRDRTHEITRAHGLRLIAEGDTRADQLNAAASAAGGDVLVFLHADSRLPDGAFAAVAAAVRDPDVIGGNFELRFEGDDRFARILTAAYALQRRLGFYYGDSSLWVRHAAFERLGGFRSLPIMDDYDFVRRLEAAGRTACLPGPALTSSRRWRMRGVARTLAVWWLIRLLFVAGVSPRRLAGLYARVR